MQERIKIFGGLLISLMVLNGCTKLSADQAFLHVSEDVYKRTGNKISWNTGTSEDRAVLEKIRGLLSRQLSAASAVQIALLNNRSLQATYTELGIAQADLVQAGLLKNPILDAAVTFPEGSNTPNLAFGLAFKFIEIFWIPLRKEAAESELETAKIRVSGQVIDHASKTHLAFIDYVAARQQVDLLKQVARSVSASVDTAKALRKAGNITQLQYDQQKSALTQSRLDLAGAESSEAEMREKLNVLMGLSGSDTNWTAPKRLTDVPVKGVNFSNIEAVAIGKSLDLAEVRQDLMTLAIKYRLTNVQSLLPDLEAGVEYERDDGEKSRGPTVEIEIPIFDTGEARRAKARMEIQRLRNRYWDIGVRIRSAARLLKARVLTGKKTVSYYEQSVLPESDRIVKGMQRDYNAMQASVFQLINAKRQQIQAGKNYIEARHSYWQAFIAFQQLMNGRLPDSNAGTSGKSAGSAQVAGQDSGGH